jgi:2-succinyl-6-hydroxy-2,4-cyclohexadiene-1-carboxylate synthase
MDPWPCRTLGDPGRPRLVFVHGFLGRGQYWDRIAASFAPHYCCVLPDLPGHGTNDSLPLETELSYEVMALGLQRTLAQLGPGPVILAGYSLGGRIALYTALRFPQLARALFLVSANPGIAEPQLRERRRAVDDQQAEIIHTSGLDAFLERWYDQPLFQSLRRRPELLDQLRAAKSENRPRWMEKTLRELSPGRQPALGGRWRELQMPVLLLAGALDEKYATLARETARNAPPVRAVIVPGAGHVVQAEQPARFIRVLRAFLNAPAR